MMGYFLVALLLVTGQGIQGHVLRNVKGKNSGSCSSINMISREKWGARPPKSTIDIKVPVSEFFIHHTDTPECFNLSACCLDVRGIQKFHMEVRGGCGVAGMGTGIQNQASVVDTQVMCWDDIGYSFLVGEDGNVYEGRGWTHVGAHTKGYNSKSFGTSVIGNYMDKLPNEKALYALEGLIACGVELGKLSPDYRLYGHRDAGTTDCPGDTFYKLIQTWPHYSHKPPHLFLLEGDHGIDISDHFIS